MDITYFYDSLIYLEVTCLASGRDPEEYRKTGFFSEMTSGTCFGTQRNACGGTPNECARSWRPDSELESESHDYAGLATTGTLHIENALNIDITGACVQSFFGLLVSAVTMSITFRPIRSVVLPTMHPNPSSWSRATNFVSSELDDVCF